MSEAELKTIIVKDCDNCVLKAINSSNEGGVTVCSIEKSADTFCCTFGLVPQKCPLIDFDIIVKLRKDTEVMNSNPRENK